MRKISKFAAAALILAMSAACGNNEEAAQENLQSQRTPLQVVSQIQTLLAMLLVCIPLTERQLNTPIISTRLLVMVSSIPLLKHQPSCCPPITVRVR